MFTWVLILFRKEMCLVTEKWEGKKGKEDLEACNSFESDFVVRFLSSMFIFLHFLLLGMYWNLGTPSRWFDFSHCYFFFQLKCIGMNLSLKFAWFLEFVYKGGLWVAFLNWIWCLGINVLFRQHNSGILNQICAQMC